MLPDTNLLMFIAHYDGSWLNYMQDFVDRQPAAPTAIWTNTAGFPPTHNLIHGGVEDGDRVTRWFHNQQRSTDFVYAALPNLTLSTIRSNAAICRGFATASSEPEARAWLALSGGRSPVIPVARQDAVTPAAPASDTFAGRGTARFQLRGSHPGLRHHVAPAFRRLRPLRLWEGPGGVPRLATGHCARHRLRPARRAIQGCPHNPCPIPSLALGLSPSGLTKLGLSASDLGTFPASFIDGMSSPGRARLPRRHARKMALGQ